MIKTNITTRIPRSWLWTHGLNDPIGHGFSSGTSSLRVSMGHVHVLNSVQRCLVSLFLSFA